MSIRDITDVRERVNHDEPCPNTKKDVLGVFAHVLSIIKQRYPLHNGSDLIQSQRRRLFAVRTLFYTTKC